jgi:hypothetical protein
VAWTALSIIFSLPFSARAQQQQNPNASQAAAPAINSPTTPEPDPTLHHMAERMAMERNIERQKQIVSDTARLLQLAQQLNNEVSKSSKDTLSVSVVKRAEQIEKLAKSIKDKMRDGE